VNLSHVEIASIHAYANRAKALTIIVETDEQASDWLATAFRIADLVEVEVTPGDVDGNVVVDVDLTAENLDLPPRLYRAELVTVIGGELRTRGLFKFQLDPAPTDFEEDES
jgi:hypothetical protein